MSVGLIVVRLKYGLYVGHLSKWFVFVLMFKIWSVCRLVNGRPTIGYNVLSPHPPNPTFIANPIVALRLCDSLMQTTGCANPHVNRSKSGAEAYFQHNHYMETQV